MSKNEKSSASVSTVKYIPKSIIKSDYTSIKEQVKSIYDDLKRVELLRSHQTGSRSLDLMFIMDCTASMSSWIEACKVEIKAIIAFIQTQFFKMKVRVSIIGYRDFSEPAA